MRSLRIPLDIKRCHSKAPPSGRNLQLPVWSID